MSGIIRNAKIKRMSTKAVTRGLTVLFCVLVIFLAGSLLFPKADPPPPPADPPPVQRPVAVAKREAKALERVEPERKTVTQATEPREKAPRPQAEPEKPAALPVIDPDEEFLKVISSLPLPRAVLETRLEVEGRIKRDEKNRAKLIFSEDEDGKLTVAYAVKRASVDEVEVMTRPFKLVLDLQKSYSYKKYVEYHYDLLFKRYRLAEAEYQLLYAVIPKNAPGSPVLNYTYPASSEEECIQILREELVPKPPVVIGVPYTSSSRERSSASAFGIRPGDWRMDELVAEELLHPYYRSSDRARLMQAKGLPAEK
jgi:hypothetical protein